MITEYGIEAKSKQQLNVGLLKGKPAILLQLT